jgi:putative two-component system response regulator
MKLCSTDRRMLLLLDDCVSERDLYEFVLKDHFEIVTATRGVDALALAASARPDIIVLDVMMPGLTGWETCARIKSNPTTADIPVILLTGVDDVDLTQHAFAVAADAVNKPCSADRLLECVQAAVERHSFGAAERRHHEARQSWFAPRRERPFPGESR